MDKFGHFRGKCYLALSLVSDDNFMNLLSKISRILTFRRRGPGRTLCSYHHHLLLLPVPGDHPRVSLHVCQGGAGVREGRHLQAGQAESRWSQGAGTLLRHALHWYLQKSCKLTEIPRFRWKIPIHTEPTENVFSGPQDSQLRCPSTRGDIQTKYWHWYYSSSWNIASKNCFCSINTYSRHPIHWYCIEANPESRV